MHDEIKTKLVSAYQSIFGKAPEVCVRAPGRLEILGNHTDYNGGVVLSVAVDKATFVAAGKTTGTICTVKDIRDNSVRAFELTNLGDKLKGDWANYIKGLIVELNGRGKTVPAFNAVFLSTVPMSAGMSSSASLEMAFCLVLAKLGGIDLAWQDWAKIGQACENKYVGANTGLLDQFSSLKGKEDCLVYSDFRSLEVKTVPMPKGVALVVANSMVKHNLTNEYNDRRASCEDAAATLGKFFPQVKQLRDATTAMLDEKKAALKPESYQRALHPVGEDERVFAGIQALEKGDINTFGKYMFDSHESSRVHFENSTDELDILVNIAKHLPGAYGARLSGGGFGGITVHLVEASKAEQYAKALAEEYKSRTGLDTPVVISKADDGAGYL
jgi:galactokinase